MMNCRRLKRNKEVNMNCLFAISDKNNTSIDMVKTGQKIREYMCKKGMTVKNLQDYLGFSCPQSIYRWFKGLILPSVDNLYRLSRLFNVHMEDLLVVKEEELVLSLDDFAFKDYIGLCNRRMEKYVLKMAS